MGLGIDLQAVLNHIAEREPLQATLDAFPTLAEDDLRAALKALARRQAGRSAALVAEVGQASLPGTQAVVAEPAPARRPARPAAAAGDARALVVYSDGASRGNPGPAGAGWVICEPGGRQIATGGIYLGRRTNNEAEYLAAAMGLKAASEMGGTNVTLRADSELMVRQLQGRYQVKNAKLLPLFRQVKQLTQEFAQFTAQHVPRAQNAAADEQANIAIDEQK